MASVWVNFNVSPCRSRVCHFGRSSSIAYTKSQLLFGYGTELRQRASMATIGGCKELIRLGRGEERNLPVLSDASSSAHPRNPHFVYKAMLHNSITRSLCSSIVNVDHHKGTIHLLCNWLLALACRNDKAYNMESQEA